MIRSFEIALTCSVNPLSVLSCAGPVASERSEKEKPLSSPAFAPHSCVDNSTRCSSQQFVWTHVQREFQLKTDPIVFVLFTPSATSSPSVDFRGREARRDHNPEPPLVRERCDTLSVSLPLAPPCVSCQAMLAPLVGTPMWPLWSWRSLIAWFSKYAHSKTMMSLRHCSNMRMPHIIQILVRKTIELSSEGCARRGVRRWPVLLLLMPSWSNPSARDYLVHGFARARLYMNGRSSTSESILKMFVLYQRSYTKKHRGTT